MHQVSYYGNLEPIKIDKHNSVGIFIVNEIFNNMLDKYKFNLECHQLSLLTQFRKVFQERMEKLDDLNKRLTSLEKKFNVIKLEIGSTEHDNH